MERFTHQRVRFWTRQGAWVYGSAETCEFVFPDDGSDPLETYEESYQYDAKLVGWALENLLLSLKFLLFFLGLIWLINIRPLKHKNQSTNQKG